MVFHVQRAQGRADGSRLSVQEQRWEVLKDGGVIVGIRSAVDA